MSTAAFEYLLRIDESHREHHARTSRSLRRQKLFIFLNSILISCFLIWEFQPAELLIFGIKFQKLEFGKIVLVIPLLLSYQFVYYSISRLQHRIVGFRHQAVRKEISSRVGIDLEGLYKNHPYISRGGSIYDLSMRDKFNDFSWRLMTAVTWSPFALALGLAITKGTSTALATDDNIFIIIYTVALEFSIIAMFLAKIAGVRAFRKRRCRKVNSSNTNHEADA